MTTSGGRPRHDLYAGADGGHSTMKFMPFLEQGRCPHRGHDRRGLGIPFEHVVELMAESHPSSNSDRQRYIGVSKGRNGHHESPCYNSPHRKHRHSTLTRYPTHHIVLNHTVNDQESCDHIALHPITRKEQLLHVTSSHRTSPL